MNPRDQLARITDDELDDATGLSGFLIRSQIRAMDQHAPGGISAVATLIASLAVRLVHAHRPVPVNMADLMTRARQIAADSGPVRPLERPIDRDAVARPKPNFDSN